MLGMAKCGTLVNEAQYTRIWTYHLKPVLFPDKMQLVLNQYVRNTADKFLTPLLKENGCGDLKPQLNSMMFNFAKTPDKAEWSRLTLSSVAPWIPRVPWGWVIVTRNF